ncbi:homoserine O-acetyltransferase/O-succinyltransferase family protein [Eupransor demetentiae]|uniref:Homoserine O-acetyltransferase n=1 Tax=Eupransor demetentiae TaxID=3109584 RepID=A0ABM9N5H7_9LACO|nr:Homoserine O-succinyltransferase (MetA) [Lactobacillaceae bacterium LMG 33000]
MGKINILNGYNKNCTRGDRNGINLVIVNLMPTRAETEHQFISVLKNAPYNFNLTFAGMASHHYRHFADDIREKYVTLNQIEDKQYDALLISGAPLDRKSFNEIDYWDEFKKWLDWRKDHVRTSLFTCWAAWAAGEIEGVCKGKQLEEKTYGVYQTQAFTMPHSRYFRIEKDSLRPQAECIAGNQELGATLFHDRDLNSYYVTGHLEYSTQTLAQEFRRDRERGLKTAEPKNYFGKNKRPHNSWQRSTRAFYRLWLSPFVNKKLQ